MQDWRSWLLTLLTTFLLLLQGPSNASQTVCDQDSWYMGYTSSDDSWLWTTMDFCIPCLTVAIGGAKKDLSSGYQDAFLMLKDASGVDPDPQIYLFNESGLPSALLSSVTAEIASIHINNEEDQPPLFATVKNSSSELIILVIKDMTAPSLSMEFFVIPNDQAGTWNHQYQQKTVIAKNSRYKAMSFYTNHDEQYLFYLFNIVEDAFGSLVITRQEHQYDNGKTFDYLQTSVNIARSIPTYDPDVEYIFIALHRHESAMRLLIDDTSNRFRFVSQISRTNSFASHNQIKIQQDSSRFVRIMWVSDDGDVYLANCFWAAPSEYSTATYETIFDPIAVSKLSYPATIAGGAQIEAFDKNPYNNLLLFVSFNTGTSIELKYFAIYRFLGQIIAEFDLKIESSSSNVQLFYQSSGFISGFAAADHDRRLIIMNPLKELLLLNYLESKVTDCATFTRPTNSAVSIEEPNDTSNYPGLHWGIIPAIREQSQYNNELIEVDSTSVHSTFLASTFQVSQLSGVERLVNPCGIKPAYEIQDAQTYETPTTEPLILSDQLEAPTAENFCPGTSPESLPTENQFIQVEIHEYLNTPKDLVSVMHDTSGTNKPQLSLLNNPDGWNLGSFYNFRYSTGFSASLTSAEFISGRTIEYVSFWTVDGCTIDDMTLPTFSDMDSMDAFYIFGTRKRFTFSVASHLCNFETSMVLIWHKDLDTNQSLTVLTDQSFTWNHQATQQTLTLEYTASLDMLLGFRYTIQEVGREENVLFETRDYQLKAFYCPMTAPPAIIGIGGIPTFTYEVRKSDGAFREVIDLSGGYNGSCGFTGTINFSPAATLSSLFTELSATNELQVTVQNPNLADTYLLSYSMENTEYDQQVDYDFLVELEVDCALSLPTIFQQASVLSFDMDLAVDEVVKIDLTGASNRECFFNSTVTAFNEDNDYSSSISVVNTVEENTFDFKATIAQSILIDLSGLEASNHTIYFNYTMHSQWQMDENSPRERLFQVYLYRQEQPTQIYCLDEPFLDSSAIGTLKLKQASKATVIELGADIVSNKNCYYHLQLLTDTDLISLEPPLFEVAVDENSQQFVSVKEKAKIRVETDKTGLFSATLQVIFEPSNISENLEFTVEIKPCESITEDGEDTVTIQYALGQGPFEHEFVKKIPSCPNSYWAMNSTNAYEQFFNLTVQDDDVSWSMVMDIGEKQQQDVYKAGDTISIDVSETNIIQTLSFVVHVIIEIPLESVSSWIDDMLSRKVETVDKNFEPFYVQPYDLSRSGNLTLWFSRPIIDPPIEIIDISEQRRLQALDGIANENEYKKLPVQQVVKITVDSVYHEDEPQQVQISDYYATRLTQQYLDIQLIFQHPNQLTRDRIEPDRLKIEFLYAEMFMDKEDFQVLEESFGLEKDVQPQLSAEAVVELEQFEETLESTMAAFSVGNLALNLLLSIGIKYLWNMVNILQFVIFIAIHWQNQAPQQTIVFLKSLKMIALLEFLPTDEIDDTLLDWFGIQNECEGNCEEESTFDELAVVLLAAFVIVLLCLILIILKALVRCCGDKVKACFLILKQKLFFGTLIRYALLSSLKIQITFAAGLAIGPIIEATLLHPAKSTAFIVGAWITLTVLQLIVPLLFGTVLFKNRQQLDAQEVKLKIGAMYELHNAQKPYVTTYSVVFLVRRSFFVITSFGLYLMPALQVQLMLCMTLFHLCYLSKIRFHQSPFHRRIEMTNECLLMCLCYHVVLFVSPAWELDLLSNLGVSTIGFLVILLGLNTLIIIYVNFKVIYLKLKLKLNKRKMHKLRTQFLQEVEAKRAAAIALHLAQAQHEQAYAVTQAQNENLFTPPISKKPKKKVTKRKRSSRQAAAATDDIQVQSFREEERIPQPIEAKSKQQPNNARVKAMVKRMVQAVTVKKTIAAKHREKKVAEDHSQASMFPAQLFSNLFESSKQEEEKNGEPQRLINGEMPVATTALDDKIRQILKLPAPANIVEKDSTPQRISMNVPGSMNTYGFDSDQDLQERIGNVKYKFTQSLLKREMKKLRQECSLTPDLLSRRSKDGEYSKLR